MVEHVNHENLKLAIIIRSQFKKNGIEFFTDNDSRFTNHALCIYSPLPVGLNLVQFFKQIGMLQFIVQLLQNLLGGQAFPEILGNRWLRDGDVPLGGSILADVRPTLGSSVRCDIA